MSGLGRYDECGEEGAVHVQVRELEPGVHAQDPVHVDDRVDEALRAAPRPEYWAAKKKTSRSRSDKQLLDNR